MVNYGFLFSLSFMFLDLRYTFRVQICTQKKTILSVDDIIALIGDKCDGVIGQVTFLSLEFLFWASILVFFYFPFDELG